MTKLNLNIVGFFVLIISSLNSCSMLDDEDKLYKGSDIVGKWILTEATCNGSPYEWESTDFYEFDEYGWVNSGRIEKKVTSRTRYEYVDGKVYIGLCYDWNNDLEECSPSLIKEGQYLVERTSNYNYHYVIRFRKQ